MVEVNNLEDIMNIASQVIDLIALIIIFVGLVYAFSYYFYRLYLYKNNAFKMLRIQIAKTILLTLELLIVSDIILTLTTPNEIDSIVALGLIVLLRIILSIEMEREITGEISFFNRANINKDK